MNSPPNTISPNNYDYLISIEQQKIAGNLYLPIQINFEIEDKDLLKIKQQKKELKPLKLSPELLANLRYYSLSPYFNDEAGQLVFITYYIKGQQRIAVMKTIISVRGKISQQISRQFFDNPPLLNRLVESHYWLISQISDRLSLNYTNKSSWLIWGLSVIVLLLITPFFLFFISTSGIFKLIILVGLFFLIKIGIQSIAKRYLPSFILQQLLFGLLSKKTAKRRLGFILLRYFSS